MRYFKLHDHIGPHHETGEPDVIHAVHLNIMALAMIPGPDGKVPGAVPQTIKLTPIDGHPRIVASDDPRVADAILRVASEVDPPTSEQARKPKAATTTEGA